MPRRYQYDIQTGPLSESPENVHVDAWMQQPTPPQRKWALQRIAAAVVVLAAASGMAPIDPNALTKPEAVHVEAWRQPENRAQFGKEYRAAVYQDSSGNQRNFAVINHPENETWHAEYPNAVARPFPEAVYASSIFFVPVTATAEVVTLDKWFEPASVPVRLPAQIIEEQSLKYALPEVNIEQVDRWHPVYPDQIVRIPRVFEAESIEPVFVPETVTLDKWFEASATPVRIPRTLEAESVEPVSTSPESVSVDKFKADFPDAVARGQVQQSTSAAFVPIVSTAEVITPDKWHPIYPDQFPPKFSTAAFESASGNQRNFAVINHPENETWHPEYPNAIARPYPEATYAQTLSFVPVVAAAAETITIDKWHPTYPDAFPPKFSTAAYETATGNQRNFGILYHLQPRSYYEDWLIRPYPEATYVASGTSYVLPFAVPENITLDKWFQPPSQPTRIPARSAALDQSVIDPSQLTKPEATSVDKWHPQLPDVIVRNPARTEPGQFITGNGLTAAEQIFVDKWWQPTSQPTRLLPRQVAVEIRIDTKALTLQEIVHVEAWMQPPQYPAAFETLYGRSTSRLNYYPALYASGMAPIDEKQLATPETVRIDKFAPDYPSIIVVQPARSVALLSQVVIDAKALTITEPVTIDRFGPDYPSWNARRFPEATYVASGSFYVLPVVGETPGVDKWAQPTNQPVRLPARSPQLGQSVIDPKALTQPKAVTLDQWFQPASEPARLRPRAAHGQTIIDPRILTQPEQITLDKFQPVYPNWLTHVPNIATLVASGEYFTQVVVFLNNVKAEAQSGAQLRAEASNVQIGQPPQYPAPPAPTIVNGMLIGASTSQQLTSDATNEWTGRQNPPSDDSDS